jgi:hypothetical protein
MVKMEIIRSIIFFFLHPTYKTKFQYFNFINKAYYFINFFIYQLLYALFFHEKTFLYWKLVISKFIAFIKIEIYVWSYNIQS